MPKLQRSSPETDSKSQELLLKTEFMASSLSYLEPYTERKVEINLTNDQKDTKKLIVKCSKHDYKIFKRCAKEFRFEISSMFKTDKNTEEKEFTITFKDVDDIIPVERVRGLFKDAIQSTELLHKTVNETYCTFDEDGNVVENISVVEIREKTLRYTNAQLEFFKLAYFIQYGTAYRSVQTGIEEIPYNLLSITSLPEFDFQKNPYLYFSEKVDRKTSIGSVMCIYSISDLIKKNPIWYNDMFYLRIENIKQQEDNKTLYYMINIKSSPEPLKHLNNLKTIIKESQKYEIVKNIALFYIAFVALTVLSIMMNTCLATYKKHVLTLLSIPLLVMVYAVVADYTTQMNSVIQNNCLEEIEESFNKIETGKVSTDNNSIARYSKSEEDPGLLSEIEEEPQEVQGLNNPESRGGNTNADNTDGYGHTRADTDRKTGEFSTDGQQRPFVI